jgi:hypothetical protein
MIVGYLFPSHWIPEELKVINPFSFVRTEDFLIHANHVAKSHFKA